ncbi:stage III sporulation protein AC [Senegalia massiliensis]|jgi:stage III sporulation protein AC|uniref:Stage III sporulation protein AC n=1 Tax=Senegalia massiliensis TaxID=1720316 RepID=A0A845R248_9CLOT|nr:stage III sporulation protein AC [Senegalia massiliensis]NBI06653.1 stage III sporulation protein AC [Senegalia massiliensis]
MSVDIIFKIAGIGLLVSITNQVLIRAEREEMATMVTLVGIVMVLGIVIDLVTNLFDSVKSIFGLY